MFVVEFTKIITTNLMPNIRFIKITATALVMLFTANKAMAEELNLSSSIPTENSSIVNRDTISATLPIIIPPIKIQNTSISQITPSLPTKIPAAFTSLNLASPSSPAAQLFGLGEGKITTISTPDQFGLQVLNGLDNDGRFNTGIAVDTLPYVLIRGNDLTLEDYRSSWFQRFASNTKFSIATTKSEDKTSTVRAGLGIEFVLINEGDPRMDEEYANDLLKIQGDILKEVSKIGGPKATPQKLKEAATAFNPEIEKVKARAEKRAGQKPMWTVALGQSWVSPTGLYSNLQGEGMGAWTTYRQKVGDESQLLLHASTRGGERVSDKKGGFVNADTLVGGVRYQSGNRDFRFSLETAYNRESQGGQKINDYLSFGVGFEPRIFDNSWLSVSFGGNTGRQTGTDFQFRTGIKWNINPGYVEAK
jgi:hypothetical protein